MVIGWAIHLVPHALQLGFDPYQSARLATAGGIEHIIDSLIFANIDTDIFYETVLYSAPLVISLVIAIAP